MDFDNRIKVEKLIEDKKYKEGYRKYLGVSQLGHPCKRYLYYQFRFFLPPRKITAREKRLFNRGHNEEPIVFAELESIDVKISGTQDPCSCVDGHIKGHRDALFINVPDAPKTPHLGEIKTSSLKYFKPFMAGKFLKETFFSHYCQCQGYMHLYKLKRALYICTCKDNDSRHYERIKYNKKFSKSLIEKGKEVIFAPVAPERIGDSNYYHCGPKWCEYRDICHFKAFHQINKTCRNCKDVEIHDKARWFCKKRGKFLSFKKQQKHCKYWELV